MALNYLYLRAFHTVATERSFTRAAQVLRVSQSTLSAQVKALEDWSGLRLLDRGQQVTATAAGEEVLEISREIFRLQDEIEALFERTRRLESGRLKVGADGPRHIMPVMSEFIGLHPNVAVSLTTGNAKRVLRDLLNYDTDVAIVAMSKPRHAGLHMVPFRTYQLVAFVARSHPWAGRQSVCIQDFAGERIILREQGSMIRQMLLSALSQSRVQPAAIVEINDREASREAVAFGLGIGIMSVIEFPTQDNRTVPITIDDKDLTITEYVACLEKKKKHRTVAEFIRIAHSHREAARSGGGI